MKEKLTELYQDYLEQKLNLIFKGENGISFSNNLSCIVSLSNHSPFDKRIEIFDNLAGKNLHNSAEENMHLFGKGRFDYVYDFWQGYAIVQKNNKYNFIDIKGQLIGKEWYDFVRSFNQGFAVIQKNEKWNFIDTKGQLVSKEEWYDSVYDFKEGYAAVQKGGKWNFINTKGQLISKEEWYDSVYDFNQGYAAVQKASKWNFINTKGQLASNEWYDSVRNFNEGYVTVKKAGKWNFIDTKGQLVSKEEWYDSVYDFKEGYAAVQKSGKWNFIDKNGKLISDRWYDQVFDFCNGFAKVNSGPYCNLININGQRLIDGLCHEIGDFHCGYARIRLLNKTDLSRSGELFENSFNNKLRYCNYIDENGRLLNQQLYDETRDFKEGHAAVKMSGLWNFVDVSGNLISSKWYDNVYDFKNGVALVENDGQLYYIDSKGNTIFNSLKKTDVVYCTQNFIKINDKITCKSIDVGDYKISKTLFGYVCKNSYEKIKLKYHPIKKFGFRYMLCINNENLFLYDRISNSYQNYGNILEVSYDDNFIFDEKNDTICLIYENQILDVTSYYKNNLLGKEKINISSGVTDILSKDDFHLSNMQNIEKILQDERKTSKLIKEKRENEKIVNDLENIKLLSEENDRSRKAKELGVLRDLQKNLNALQQVSSTDNTSKKLKVDNIFVQVEEHLEIMPVFVNMLKYIDLSLIDFKNVKIDGIDFTGCNLNFDPQVVFQKNLTNCNFEGIYIGPLINFSGVDIRGARFGNDNDLKTLDFFNVTFKNAIYDNTTTYNGVPITEFLDKDKVSNNSRINL